MAVSLLGSGDANRRPSPQIKHTRQVAVAPANLQPQLLVCSFTHTLVHHFVRRPRGYQ